MARSGDEVVDRLPGLTAERARAIGSAAYRRVLAEHTYAHRAATVEAVLEGRMVRAGAVLGVAQ